MNGSRTYLTPQCIESTVPHFVLLPCGFFVFFFVQVFESCTTNTNSFFLKFLKPSSHFKTQVIFFFCVNDQKNIHENKKYFIFFQKQKLPNKHEIIFLSFVRVSTRKLKSTMPQSLMFYFSSFFTFLSTICSPENKIFVF